MQDILEKYEQIWKIFKNDYVNISNIEIKKKSLNNLAKYKDNKVRDIIIDNIINNAYKKTSITGKEIKKRLIYR